MSDCEVHGTAMRAEPLTRFDGTQIGTLSIDVCDACDAETDADLKSFLGRVASGDFPETAIPEGQEQQ